MKPKFWLLTAALLAVTLSGCLGGDDDDNVPAGRTEGPVGGTFTLTEDLPMFSDPVIFDDVRAGGEPVIAVLQSGTLLISSHPGWTHYHPGEDPPASSELLVPANGQSYLWRSTDGGTTWQHVNLDDLTPNLPRSTALGVSDPEFTVLDDGTVCMTDLIALAESSVSCSMDDGQTWGVGNSAASEGANDRQWLASTGNELYFVANYLAPGEACTEEPAPEDCQDTTLGERIQASNDYGMTWEIRGEVPCSQDLVSNPHTDHLVSGCTGGITVSEDGGRTWSEIRRFSAPEHHNVSVGGARIMSEPAIDAAGNTWVVSTRGEEKVYVAGTPDEGLSWPWLFEIGPHFAAYAEDNPHGQEFLVEEGNGTFVWPWISAGSDGRFAVTWIGSYDNTASDEQSGPYYIFTAFFLDATTDHPTVHVTTLTPDPIHVQPICQSGTTCQATSLQGQEAGDRRLGDFFETTIDADGFLHATWSNTAAEPEDVISHPQYARQTGGIRLLSDEDIGVYMPTQG